MTSPIAISATHEHKLSSTLLTQRVRVLLVGCGGTGSTMAVGLVYLHQALMAFGHPGGLQVTVVDGDLISRANCVRQPFSETEIGLYKADVIVSRINMFWGLDWTSETRFLNDQWRGERQHLLISCVDSRKARKSVMQSQAYTGADYWLDLGNNSDSGQFVLGEPATVSLPKGVRRLPNVADLFPEIIDPKLDAKDKLPSCSALEALESQSPFINQALAYQALGMLAQLFRRGKLAYHGGFMNLSTGRMTPLPINPVVWKRLSQGERVSPPGKTECGQNKRRNR